MIRKTWLASLAGAGVLVAGSLTASTAHAISGASASAPVLGAYTASGDLISGRYTVRSWHHRGRGHDGHGGEHSGGAQRSDTKRRSSPATPVANKKKAKPPKSGRGDSGRGDSGRGDNGRGGHHNGCHYPPSGPHQIVLSGPKSTRQGKTVTLTGKVAHNGCSVDGAEVGLYSSHDGKTGWVQIRTATVAKDGSYSFSVPSWALHYYQSAVASGDGSSPVASKILPLPLRRSGR